MEHARAKAAGVSRLSDRSARDASKDRNDDEREEKTMSNIRTYLKAALDRAHVLRYNHKVSADAAAFRRSSQRVDHAKLGGISYI
jgi:hypothetical protein